LHLNKRVSPTRRESHVRAFVRERTCHRRTDAAGGPGHHRYPAPQRLTVYDGLLRGSREGAPRVLRPTANGGSPNSSASASGSSMGLYASIQPPLVRSHGSLAKSEIPQPAGHRRGGYDLRTWANDTEKRRRRRPLGSSFPERVRFPYKHGSKEPTSGLEPLTC
jgi:hypothetical protein